ncbi:MAG: cysteine desulfurase family protein [Tenericutes bacterium]|jgi:cysteine desulfurase|nr:cysteine desulfurase family protein [Mycoplasmatota bacterium]
MVYLDYSATTPVSMAVLDEDYLFNQRYFANSNSVHALGKEALVNITNTTKLIKKSLNLLDHKVIYTSGATESNNLALKGIALKNKHLGNHIITTPFEHGSITATLNYLAKQGFVVDVVEMDEEGLVDLDDLESLITDNTILVSIGLVNSELGIVQNLSKIAEILKKHSQIVFHSDMTQGIGKVLLDYSVADLISLSGHKIYGFKGIGALLHRKDIKLTPIIHGGKSISNSRGGTPPTSLIHSLGKAIDEIYKHIEINNPFILELKEYLLSRLKGIKDCYINSNRHSIPQIVNISYTKASGKEMQKYFSDHDIYLSTTSACSSDKAISKVVKEITGDYERAVSSLRISLSHLTTKAEIDEFIKVFGAYDESH